MTRKVTRNYSLSVVAAFLAAGPRFGSTKLAAAAIRGALTLAVLSALLLVGATPAQAQTEHVLYNFTGGNDGGDSIANLTSDGAGNFYGTTLQGGLWGEGTVFELSPNGSGGWNETVLHSFCSDPLGCRDGGEPGGPVIFDSAGNLYGTASGGGADGGGVVFELSPVGANWTYNVLYSFYYSGDSGIGPYAGLVMDAAGNLYGTTSWDSGGTGGAVFELSPSGGGWTEQAIYGYGSYAGLTMNAAGNIFGATNSTVFELSPNGSGGWNPTVIHTFAGPPKDGSGTRGTPLLDQAGNLYGTTLGGGAYSNGTVYKLSPGKNGEWTERILHSFKGGKDGSNPRAGIVLDTAGNIYGTTVGGGKYGAGTVFELVALIGSGGYRKMALWNFSGPDGDQPESSLILDSAGNLYGTTYEGGSDGYYGYGVVFEVTGVRAATATTLTSSPNPSAYGQAVTFTAVVSSRTGAPPDGEIVKFKEGTTVLGTGVLSGGSASFTTSTLPVGTNAIKAVYKGDLYFLDSTSKAVNQVVN
jgi:uncharacterized repeat protein (TIGR03803 family)